MMMRRSVVWLLAMAGAPGFCDIAPVVKSDPSRRSTVRPELISYGPRLSVDVAEIAAHPERYANKLVVTIGVFMRRGNSFFLLDEAKATANLEGKRPLPIFIGVSTWEQFAHAEGRWIAIHGVIKRDPTRPDGGFGIGDVMHIGMLTDIPSELKNGSLAQGMRRNEMHPLQRRLMAVSLADIVLEDAPLDTILNVFRQAGGWEKVLGHGQLIWDLEDKGRWRVTLEIKGPISGWEFLDIVAHQIGAIVKIIEPNILISERCFE